MYAVIQTGGKQYKVREGDTIDVELLGGDVGDTVELDQVLMVADDGETIVGTPTVDGAVVRATVVDEIKGDKVVVFKYKPKNRYARKTGHRQKYNRLQIGEIVLPGAAEEATETPDEMPAAEVPAAEEDEELAETTAEVEVDKGPETEETASEEIDELEIVEEPTAEAGEETAQD